MTNKKNIASKLVLALFILTLISCCLLGSTFARYASGGSGQASIGVALWDVAITDSAETSFEEVKLSPLDDEWNGTTARTHFTGKKLVATIVNSGEVDALVTVTTGELVATSTSGSWGTGISVDGSGVVTNNGATQDQTEELFTITLYYNATEDSAEDAKALSTSQNVVAETGVIYIYAEVTWTSDDLATNATAAYADALDTWVGENVASVGCTLTYSAVQNSTRPTT